MGAYYEKIIIFLLIILSLYGYQTNDNQLATPSNVFLQHNIIRYDNVVNATHYVIDVNGEEIEITGTSYYIEAYGDITVRVKARAKDYKDSNYSSVLTLKRAFPFEDIRLNYSIHSSKDLHILTLPENISTVGIMSDDIEIGMHDFTKIDNNLVFKQSYLNTLDKGVYTYAIDLRSFGSFTLEISITDNELPYLVSNNIQSFSGNDLLLNFELFGGSFVGLSGNGITTDDYEITDSTVKISNGFLSQCAMENPEETALSITYDFVLDDHYVFGYIFIDLTQFHQD